MSMYTNLLAINPIKVILTIYVSMDINASSSLPVMHCEDSLQCEPSFGPTCVIVSYFTIEHFLVMSILLENGDRIPSSHFPSSCSTVCMLLQSLSRLKQLHPCLEILSSIIGPSDDLQFCQVDSNLSRQGLSIVPL